MPENATESLNVYDSNGGVVGTRPRAEAGRCGLAVGAVSVLLVKATGHVLLQKRRPDRDNGGLWDKSVGGHVGAGEDFDAAAVREAGEELFGDGRSSRVHLAPDTASFAGLAGNCDVARSVVFRPAGFHLNLRDVRHSPTGGLHNVLFHVAAYVGRTDVPLGSFRPDRVEIEALRYVPPAEVDAMLVRGELAPNMAFLWLIHAHQLLALVSGA